jgi:Ca-activated chloride channel family protein
LESICLHQILLITDGCSNVGMSPVEAARIANHEGYTVNVIGVVDQGELGEVGAGEIREIAHAGGGISRIVASRELPQTVQMMTRQAMTKTIHQAVNRELRQILGGQTLEQLPPSKRGEVVEAVDEWSEISQLKIVVLIDTSLSMKPKLPAVSDAILDLSLSLRARRGKSRLSVLAFPGKDRIVDLTLDWTDQPAALSSILRSIHTKGTTPTGPALIEAIKQMDEGLDEGRKKPLPQEPWKPKSKEGLMQEYVF